MREREGENVSHYRFNKSTADVGRSRWPSISEETRTDAARAQNQTKPGRSRPTSFSRNMSREWQKVCEMRLVAIQCVEMEKVVSSNASSTADVRTVI